MFQNSEVRLSDEQVEAYERDGFVAPIDIFSPGDAADLRAALEDVEEKFPDAVEGSNRNNPHFVVPVLDAITHDSRILDVVENLIGPNFLVAGTTLFIKEPETEGYISWHQDAAYVGLEPHDWVTGWLALTDVTEENGCMRMIPGSHKAPLIDHVDTYGNDNLLTRGQTVPDVDETKAVSVPLKPGQLSLHHPRVIHASGPNKTKERRIGFALQSYIATHVEQVIGRIWVQHARGVDEFKHHDVAPRFDGTMRPKAVQFRDEANARLSRIHYAGAKRGRF